MANKQMTREEMNAVRDPTLVTRLRMGYTTSHTVHGGGEEYATVERTHLPPDIQLEAADRITRLEEYAERKTEALKDVLAHLVAAHSLLSSGGKKAAASDTIFKMMLSDYQKAINRGRAALAESPSQVSKSADHASATGASGVEASAKGPLTPSFTEGEARIPEGWKLVPVEPMADMGLRVREQMGTPPWSDDQRAALDYIEDAYRNMVAAAPEFLLEGSK